VPEPRQKRTGSPPIVHIFWFLWTVAAFFIGLAIGRHAPGRPAASAPAAPPVSLPPAAANEARCVGVLDGDTVRVEWQGNTEEIRLLGIDCPETRQGKKLQEQAQRRHLKADFVMRYGQIASGTTENWLLNRNLRIVFPSGKVERDSFGRLLAYVEQQGVDIGERLLLGGNAFLWDDVHPRQESYQLFMAEAKRQKKGIWGQP
jgi:micrococcal nuclease